MTNDLHILEIVTDCHLDINVHEISHLFSEGIEYVFNKEDSDTISQEIGKLLDLKVIKETTKHKHQIVFPIFLRKKKNEGFRMIINLEKLN